MARALLVAISGPKKVLIFRAHPLLMALEMDFPPSKSLRPVPYKKEQAKTLSFIFSSTKKQKL
jgi:hypothetical protein